MNKAAIKNFAVEARKKLIASVKDKAGRIGITKENITEAISKGQGYAVFPTHIGIETTLVGKELKQRENLVNRIKEMGYESVMEEVAYTWFNRIIAVRFMEVNDYLPSRIRVLSSETKGKFEPDIVTQAPKIDLQLTQLEVEEIISLKEKNELDKLFRLLFISQCNELGEILPELFENTSKSNKDYTEILFDISYANEDGIIRDLLKIDEEDFLEAVEIIGWMYQYYNTEPKDEAFALLKKNIKITKERIPAATQLFTPDWIVRYMVENSLGRLWLEGHPNDTLKANWKYYLDEAEQEPDVITLLEKIRAEYKNINPEEIKVIDPCMGSGHILVYAFEVLMQIYESCGYTQRDAASFIVEKNLYGLDIDDRAYQLAYFAVMMKGRKYDRRFLAKGIIPNLCSIQESNGLISFEQSAGQIQLDSLHKETANFLIQAFKDAKEYGSILDLELRDYDGLLAYIEELQQKGPDDLLMSMWLNNISAVMPELIKQAKIMAQKYDIVVTNPPYMGSSGMGDKLTEFVKRNYPDSKNDWFAVFIECGLHMLKEYGQAGFMTSYTWMCLTSYSALRKKMLFYHTITTLVQPEYHAFFDEAYVPICTFTLQKAHTNATGEYINLSNFYGAQEQPIKFREAVRNKNCSYRYSTSPLNLLKIPSAPLAYWAGDNIFDVFERNKRLGEIADVKKGMSTAKDDVFLKLWHEISIIKFIAFYNLPEAKWYPVTKGGEFKRWYGNNNYVVNWYNNGQDLKAFPKSVLRNQQYYFKDAITWTYVTTYKLNFRFNKGSCFTAVGPCVFNDNGLIYFLGLLNSPVAQYLIDMVGGATITYEVGEVSSIPIIENIELKDRIEKIVQDNITISRADWDAFETSWDFVQHPLLHSNSSIFASFSGWQQFTEAQFAQLKSNEEELNCIFIDIYALQEELTPEVEDKDVTIRKADLGRDIRSLISYAVGCMFGRYSLDVHGLAYAGGDWDDSKYKSFIPDKDNIIPITDDEYFNDDMVARFVRFVRVVYGEDTLEENLHFIADALGNKGGTSREVIRNYFFKDFYKDHVKVYRKRPIYWLFDSGKENGFKALIYLHRYNEDTVGRVRADYLHKIQAAIENAIAHCDVVFESNASASDKAKAVKQKGKLVKQFAETRIYDQAIAHIAHQRISLDLDDGVVVNYAKFQGIEVSSEGKKSVKVDLLGKIK